MVNCPGQSMQFKKPSQMTYYINCHQCDNSVEFWYDDRKRPCEKCKEIVKPDLQTLMQYHSCSSHCKEARECLGDEKYVQLVLGEIRTEQECREDLDKILDYVKDDGIKGIIQETAEKNIKDGYLFDLETDLIDVDETLCAKIETTLKDYVLSK
jgi:hypothetical protein